MNYKKNISFIKNEKGITLVSLIITIAVIFIVSSVTIYISSDRTQINNYKKLITDIELLADKVSNYYLEYGELPIVKKDNNPVIYDISSLDFERSAQDDEKYYVIDLEMMEGISLYYGKEGFDDARDGNITLSNTYVINNKSHMIYYVKGIELDGKIYHTLKLEESLTDNIPPSKPEIKVVSGIKNYDGTYMSKVEIEFVHGKKREKAVSRTEFSLDDGNNWTDISSGLLTNNIYPITEEGTYKIKSRSFDESGIMSENNELNITIAIPKIGDKVSYNEGTVHTSSINPSFEMKDMEWRILDIEDDGTIELISTKPTESKLTLNKETDWLKAEEKLDTLCNELYANGRGVIARNLKIEDINKLCNYTPSTYESYEISSKLSGKKTRDDIIIASLITQGLNIDGTQATGKYVEQWLSSSTVYSNDYGVCIIDEEGKINILSSNNSELQEGEYSLRPVIVLPANVKISMDDEKTWQISNLED